MNAFSDTIKILFNVVAVRGEEDMSISISIIIVAIIALLALIGGFVTKFRWMTLISVFLFLIAAWMLVAEFFTDMTF